MEPDKMKIISDYTLQFQAMADNLALYSSPDDAIRVLQRTIELMQERKQEPASDEFQTAILDGGTLVVTCGGCHRTYFATGNSSLYEPPVYEELLALSKSQPGKYVEVSAYEDVEFGTLNGKTVVVECDCGFVRNYERLFWNHRWIIKRFYESRARMAERESISIRELKTSIDDSLSRVDLKL